MPIALQYHADRGFTASKVSFPVDLTPLTVQSTTKSAATTAGGDTGKLVNGGSFQAGLFSVEWLNRGAFTSFVLSGTFIMSRSSVVTDLQDRYVALAFSYDQQMASVSNTYRLMLGLNFEDAVFF